MAETKTYEMNNPVTISTAEYRDLISDAATFKHDAERARNDYWREHEKLESLRRELDVANAKIESLKRYIEGREASRSILRRLTRKPKEGRPC